MNKLRSNSLKLIAVVIAMSLWVACKKDNKNETREELVLTADAKASWKGYLEMGYFNSGTIGLSGEDIFLEGDKIIGGQISIPVSSILITNELSTEEKAELLHHLQTSDFFNLAVYPFVVYKINTAEKTTVDAQGNNYLIKGSMNLLGKEIALDIPAKINITNTAVTVNAKFSFDRTKWGMTFASQENLPADKKIKNNIEVELALSATRF